MTDTTKMITGNAIARRRPWGIHDHGMLDLNHNNISRSARSHESCRTAWARYYPSEQELIVVNKLLLNKIWLSSSIEAVLSNWQLAHEAMDSNSFGSIFRTLEGDGRPASETCRGAGRNLCCIPAQNFLSKARIRGRKMVTTKRGGWFKSWRLSHPIKLLYQSATIKIQTW